jgi:hypothetical protein
MPSSKILFAISVDSKRFGTNETIHALNLIPNKYDEFHFLIADGLQLYNKAAQVDNGKPLNSILTNFRLKNDYYVERERWLKNIKPHLNQIVSTSHWNILNNFSVSDSLFHDIYRNVFISFLTLPDFKQDILDAALKHRKKYEGTDAQFYIDLSTAYIIEEIALNLRIRVINNVNDEFYLGELPLPLIKLYKNGYQVDVLTLCGLQRNETKFRFFHAPKHDDINLWIEA